MVAQEQWNSKLGFILATIGSAVGIGNIWRFSSVVGQNGGGAYLIPYLFAVIVFAVPLMILELSVGRHFQGNVISVFTSVKEKFQLFGWLVCIIVFLILSYYLVITGWTLGYVVSSLTTNGVNFSEFTSSYEPLVYFFITVLLTGFIVSFGIKKGIERISTILIPFSLILLIALAVFATTLAGFSDGLSFFLTPDFSVLTNPVIWGAAFGQAFFSLSVGFGTLITYGSYLDKKTNIPRSSLFITFSDVMIAMLAGLIIFPIVFTFGLQPTMGSELAFSTLPRAFEMMAYGQVLAVTFFLLLFFAALTSAISMLEVNVAAIMNVTKFSRKKTSIILTALLFFVGLPAALSYTSMNLSFGSVKILDFMDETLGTYGLPITALIIAVIFTWFAKKKILETELVGSKTWVNIVYPIAKYVIPSVLIITLGAGLLLHIDIGSWRFASGLYLLSSLAKGIGTLILLGCLLGISLFLMKYFKRRNVSSELISELKMKRR
jgi:neurotransmitter:Na+ symporter, NSS family